ncbi:MAG: hypothetical protein ABF271_14820 [Abyssibacter sp.]|uniref:hypothetical protein n=1 Tax=Abyssibacter sp. TaxID=2320200 RepID=UPI002E9BF9EA|nr:hypothetical protein [Pseudomonadota bacterium]
MSGETERQDRREAWRIAVAVAVLLVIIAAGALFALPLISDFAAQHLTPGVGLKSAAIAAFVLSVILFVVFAVAAGDGLIGELQFMLLGFFAFFFVLWLLIAWIF